MSGIGGVVMPQFMSMDLVDGLNIVALMGDKNVPCGCSFREPLH